MPVPVTALEPETIFKSIDNKFETTVTYWIVTENKKTHVKALRLPGGTRQNKRNRLLGVFRFSRWYDAMVESMTLEQYLLAVKRAGRKKGIYHDNAI